jgi:hypothetical protein
VAVIAQPADTKVMPEYRVYIIGPDGHFLKSVPMECADDNEATEQAKQLVDGHDVELWEHARKIARFDHKPKKSSSK